MGIYRYYEKRTTKSVKWFHYFLNEEGVQFRGSVGEGTYRMFAPEFSSWSAGQKEIDKRLRIRGFTSDHIRLTKDLDNSPFTPTPPKPVRAPAKSFIKPSKYFTQWKKIKITRIIHGTSPQKIKEVWDKVIAKHGGSEKDYRIFADYRDRFSIEKKEKVLNLNYDWEYKNYKRLKAAYDEKMTEISPRLEKYQEDMKLFKVKKKEASKNQDMILFEIQKNRIESKYGEKELKKVIRGR